MVHAGGKNYISCQHTTLLAWFDKILLKKDAKLQAIHSSSIFHSEWSKLHRVLAFLSAIGLILQHFPWTLVVASAEFYFQTDSEWAQWSQRTRKSIPYFFSYKTVFFFSFQNNPKNLDLSYKMALDLCDCLGRVKLIAKFHRTDLVICSHSREGKTPSYSRKNTVIPTD